MTGSRPGLAVGILLLASGPLFPAAAAPRSDDFMRGVVVSCPRAGQIWGTEQMSEALDDIRSLGAGWIAIHPYAWVARNGEVRHRPAAGTGYLDESVRRMRAAGMKIFWKPHLGYWGSFDWRGSIEFGSDEASWSRFFAGYRDFIVDQARFAERHGVELFAVGIEYESTMHRERDWRAVIAAVREVYSGRITYAANWDGLRRVPFWDAVDVLGVHAYFPLADEDWPSAEALEAGWTRHLNELEGLASEHGKPDRLRGDRLQPGRGLRPRALGPRHLRHAGQPRAAPPAHGSRSGPSRARALHRGHVLVEVDAGRPGRQRPRLLAQGARGPGSAEPVLGSTAGQKPRSPPLSNASTKGHPARKPPVEP